MHIPNQPPTFVAYKTENKMETEMKTNNSEPVTIKWVADVGILITKMGCNIVDYEKSEAIQLRDFLNQLELTPEKK